jgi:hypothetical protein
MWVQFPLGACESDKTSQNSLGIEDFLAGLRFEQRGRLDELAIDWQGVAVTSWLSLYTGQKAILV